MGGPRKQMTGSGEKHRFAGWEKLRTSEPGRLIAAFLIGVVAAIWLATADFPLIDRLQFVSSVPAGAVSSGHKLVQTFTATGDNISRIDLVLMKSRQSSAGKLDLKIIELADANAGGSIAAGAASTDENARAGAGGMTTADNAPVLGATLAETSLDTGTFDYTSNRRLEFDPLQVTPGKMYAFSLTSDDPEESAIQPGSNPSDEYAGGRLYIDGKPAKGDLYFAFYHNAGAGGLLDKMEPWRPFPLDSPVLVVILFLAGAAAFGWLLSAIAGNRVDL